MKSKFRKNRLNSVNVLEIINDIPEQIFSFTETKEGNKEAEELFEDLIKQNYPDLEIDIDNLLDEGIFQMNSYKLAIIHSV